MREPSILARIADVIDVLDAGAIVRELVAQLARTGVDSSGVGDQASCFPALSDTRIADEPDGASTKGKPMRRVHGPYRHHDRWRIKIVERWTGKVTHQSFSTEDEARAAVRSLRRRLAWESGVSVADALDAYEKHLAMKGNMPRTVLDDDVPAAAFLRERWQAGGRRVDADGRAELYDAFGRARRSEGRRCRSTRRGTRWPRRRRFWRGRVTKRWARANALAEVKGVGKRRRGKPQLTVDEARRWLAVGMEMAAKEDGAVAALMALLMGMRASEIADRIVRNLDDEGRLLWITDAKTQAGIRRLRVPESLQPLLRRIAAGKQPTDRLFGAKANRQTVLRHVRRICKAAGVPTVSPHGLRGTHASLAMTAGATGDLVAAALARVVHHDRAALRSAGRDC